jgi:serine/threonine protein kinase
MPNEDSEIPDDSMVYEDLTNVEHVCEKYIELYRKDSAPSVAAFASDHPEIESQILDLLPTIIMMEGARSRSYGRRKDGNVSRGSEKIDELGDYKIVREIGRGGMGIVYEAHQSSLDRRVAIKLLPKHMLNDEQVSRFHREASTAAKLHHTNIAPIYGIGQSSGFHFYAMQLLSGVPLDRYVESGTTEEEDSLDPLSINQVIEIGQQVASALHYAHEQGVLHRDIKPSNLLMDESGNVWMTDFGLAISRENETDQAASASGTLRYMSPEKFNDGIGDVTGDIYSLGITLVELLSGQPAFEGIRVNELSDEIKSGKHRRLTFHGRSLPGDLKAVLKKSISIEASDRYQSAAEFGEDLKRFSETRPVAAKQKSSFGDSIRWVKRNKAFAIACAIAASMLLTTSLVSLFSYFNVQAALDAEHDQRVRAQHSSVVASLAIDQMFDQLTGGAEPLDGRLQTNRPAENLTAESAVLAKQLSDFYSQLASQKGKASDLPIRALVARSRVGELNSRLGRYDEAANAFRIAMRGYERLMDSGEIAESDENIILISRLANRLGIVKKLSGKPQNAAADHDNAIQRLTDRLETAPSLCSPLALELARSYYYSVRQNRPGMGPNSFPPVSFSSLADEEILQAEQDVSLSQTTTRKLEDAIELLNEIENGNDEGLIDSAKHLRALCYRELVNDVLSKRTNAEVGYQQKAVSLLEDLLEYHPDNSVVKFELMRTLAEVNVFDLEIDLPILESALISLQQARQYGSELVQQFPTVESYRVELIHCHFKLSQLAAKKQELLGSIADPKIAQALEDLRSQSVRRALQGQTLLSRTNSRSFAYQAWTARFVLSLASCDSVQADSDNRDRLLGRATAILNRLPDSVANKPEIKILLRETKLMTRQALMNSGL